MSDGEGSSNVLEGLETDVGGCTNQYGIAVVNHPVPDVSFSLSVVDRLAAYATARFSAQVSSVACQLTLLHHGLSLLGRSVWLGTEEGSWDRGVTWNQN
jgi:hypothetical protein